MVSTPIQMLSAHYLTTIEKLTPSSFPTWLIQIELILTMEDSWQYVNGEATYADYIMSLPSSTTAIVAACNWKKLQINARTMIMMSLSTPLLIEFSVYKNPQELLQKITTKFEKSTIGNANSVRGLRLRLYDSRLAHEDSVDAYIKRINDIAVAFARIGSSLSEDDKITALLCGVPEDWKFLRLITPDCGQKDFKWYAEQLLSYEESRSRTTIIRSPAESQSNSQASGRLGSLKGKDKTGGTGKGQFPVTLCTNCARLGHSIDQCWAEGGPQEGKGPEPPRMGRKKL